MLLLDVHTTGYYYGSMFCPQCGSTQSDDLKFCKTCGANLQALRQLMASRESDEFDWSKTFDEGDRVNGVTPEITRTREVKAGVVTMSAGLGVMILLFVLMNGIVAGGRVSDAAAEILMRLWIVGVVPLLVGGALVFNGMFVSKKAAGKSGGSFGPSRDAGRDTNELVPPASASYLTSGDGSELGSGIPFSVTDRTTRHLQKEPRQKE